MGTAIRHRGAGATVITRLPGAALVAATTGTLAWFAVAADHREDATASLYQLPWHDAAAVAILAVLATAHYIAAAVAVRGVSNGRVGVRCTSYAQLAAAAINRIVPNGVGALGVNLRYLTRSGLAPGAAASALAVLAVVGGATDAIYVAGVTAFGPHLGLGGATAELHALAAAGVAAGQHHVSLLAGVAAVLLFRFVVRHRGRRLPKLRSATGDALTHMRSLLEQPLLLGSATFASLGTTVALSIAFVLAVHTWAPTTRALPAGALVALYWVATAAATATPLPAFFGVTEAALISGLVLGGYTSSSATTAVLIFRGITCWLPVPIGVWAARKLRRTRLL
jgi:uncharacterized membrane protein YbhN (UPF0104 family)